MFLVVFVTLMISIIGLFMQVMTLQTAKLNHAQIAFMQNMSTWENSAVALTRSQMPNFAALTADAAGTKSCSLTSTAATPPSPCKTSGGTVIALQNTTLPYSLPSGYQTAFSFASMAYSISAMASKPVYVITYVYYTDANGYIMLPDASGSSLAGQTLSSIKSQFMRGAGTTVTWGTVVSPGNLSIATPSNSSTLNFTIPYSIPTNAIAIISSVY